MTHHLAYPLGLRLGITVFWQKAISHIGTLYSHPTAKNCLVIAQWLTQWFYRQKIYLYSINLIELQADTTFLSLSFFDVPARLRKRRFSYKNRRFRKHRPRWLNRVVTIPIQRRIIFNTSFFQNVMTIDLPKSLIRLSTFGHGFPIVPYYNFYRHFGDARNNYHRMFARFCIFHMRKRQFFVREVFKHIRSRRRNRQRLPRIPFLGQHPVRSIKKIPLSQKPFLQFYTNHQFVCFIPRRAVLLPNTVKIAIQRVRTYEHRRQESTVFRRLLASYGTMQLLRFSWYLKTTMETLFHRKIRLSLTNLYSRYFQSNILTFLELKTRSLYRRYATLQRFQRNAALARLREGRKATDMSYRPPRPLNVRRFSYAQIVLFLGLQPSWRKMVSVYALCYLIVLTGILRTPDFIMQWLYRTVLYAKTRRLKRMQLRFFGLVAQLLRDYAIASNRLNGFRIEIRGKTSRSQKTRIRYFGNTRGVTRYKLSFRLRYQAFDIPTHAGVLGIRLWMF